MATARAKSGSRSSARTRRCSPAPTSRRASSFAARKRGLGSDRGRPRQKLHCHLKIDTGMNRLGFRHDNLARTLPEIARCEYLAIDAVYTHFATADEPEHPA